MDEEIIGIGVLLLLLLGKKEEKGTGPDGLKPPGPTPPRPPEPPEPTEPTEPEQTPGASDIIDVYPTPGHFYQVVSGDFLYRIASRSLRSAGFLAAREWLGMNDSNANAFASDFADSAQRQQQYLDMILCAAWNDATITTHGIDGSKTRRNPQTQRGIRLVPKHADNFSRLVNGQRPQRLMHFGKPSDRVNEQMRTGSGSNFELMWLPGLSLKAIAESRTLKLGGGKWPDGTSRANPPRWIMRLGVADRTNSMPKGNRARGCGGDKVEVF
jgi:hypothetical protein